MAEALIRLNKRSAALPLLREAIAVAPRDAVAYGKLARALGALGQVEEALQACHAGLANAPEQPELSGIAAGLLLALQRPAEAVPYLYVALERAPQIEEHWVHLYRLLLIGFLPSERARPWLIRALEHPLIRPALIAPSIAKTLSLNPLIAELSTLAASDALPRGPALAECLAWLGADALLLALMAVSPVPSPMLERLFTGLREALLDEVDRLELTPEALVFCVALANQAFLTDYAWYVRDTEQLRAEALASASMDAGASSLRIVVVACYRPLHTLAEARQIARQTWPDTLRPLIRMQLHEPFEERALRAQIPELAPITEAVSRQVRAQYEENPYPRWVRAERTAQPLSLPSLIASLGGTPVHDDASFATPDVLIAGCGTGQQIAVAASRYRNAKILAIDLSYPSLAYAARRMQELGINNVELLRADILELGAIDRRFHVIESSGVLHHMRDPMAGWRILVGLLRPRGLMNIGLYSELGRRTVVAVQTHIRERGYAPTPADIRRCRREVLEVAEDHPFASLWRGVDLYGLGTCRDLLFHVQEHRFTLPQISTALDTLGMRFLRFELPDTSDYRHRFQNDREMNALENWHVFEQEYPDTFSAMYQFWAQKS